MMDAKDLFEAMNGADEALLERSGRRKRGGAVRPLAWGLAAAACLLLAGALLLLPRTGEEDPALDSPAVIEPTAPLETEDPTPSGSPGGAQGDPLELSGGEVGTLHLLQARTQPGENAAPDFVIYVNQELYKVAQTEENSWLVSPIDPAADLPPCQLEIRWVEGTTVEEAAAAQGAALAGEFAEVSEPVESLRVEGLSLRGSGGNRWDDPQADVYVTSDGQGGAFVLTVRYFLEAAEGHGARLGDSVGTFEVVRPESSALPPWLSGLYSAAQRLTVALLADDLAAVEDLLAPGAQVDTYGADVTGEALVAGIDYTVDDDASPAAARLSIRHRLSPEEGYSYFTVELTRTGESWQVERASLEP